MTWEAAPTGKRGRQPDYSDAAIQTCLTMKVLFGMALRQTTGFVESLLRLTGPDWAVPDFSTLSRRQKTLKVDIPYRGSDGPLHLLVDSTGIKVEGEGEWNARKHGGAKRRVWRKIHIGIDEKSLKIRAAEFTTSDVGDAASTMASASAASFFWRFTNGFTSTGGIKRTEWPSFSSSRPQPCAVAQPPWQQRS